MISAGHRVSALTQTLDQTVTSGVAHLGGSGDSSCRRSHCCAGYSAFCVSNRVVRNACQCADPGADQGLCPGFRVPQVLGLGQCAALIQISGVSRARLGRQDGLVLGPGAAACGCDQGQRQDGQCESFLEQHELSFFVGILAEPGATSSCCGFGPYASTRRAGSDVAKATMSQGQNVESQDKIQNLDQAQHQRNRVG